MFLIAEEETRSNMVITSEILEQGKSSRGAWSKKQLQILEVPITKEFKLEKGWKKRLIGSDVSEEKVKLFLSLKNKHIKPKTQDLEFNPEYPWRTEGVNAQNRGRWLAMIHKKNPWLKKTG